MPRSRSFQRLLVFFNFIALTKSIRFQPRTLTRTECAVWIDLNVEFCSFNNSSTFMIFLCIAYCIHIFFHISRSLAVIVDFFLNALTFNTFYNSTVSPYISGILFSCSHYCVCAIFFKWLFVFLSLVLYSDCIVNCHYAFVVKCKSF